jgi:ubiquinone/menaquinone biosynthesis C-methylase UbiE
MCSMLSHEQARAFYDRFGSKQDWQRFYEDPATASLIRHSSLASARSVIEFGCGTGRFAESLLARHLPADARYLGIDVSSTMVALVRKRLSAFEDRVKVLLTSGETKINVASSSVDRFLSTYVLDLLADDDIRSLIDEAHRILVPGGLLGLVSLTHGFTPLSQVVEKVWVTLHEIAPVLVGGCRPISLQKFVKASWVLRYTQRITRLGVPSEVLVAENRCE